MTAKEKQDFSEILKEINEWEIKVPKYDINALYKFAQDNYDNINYHKSKKKSAFNLANSQKNFLSRITRNYLRHKLSNYELKLKEIIKLHKISKNKRKKVSELCEDAYIVLRNKIEKEITRVYPELANTEFLVKKKEVKSENVEVESD